MRRRGDAGGPARPVATPRRAHPLYRLLRLSLLLAALLAAGPFVAACDGTDGPGAGPEPGETPQPGGTYVFPLASDPVSIEPLNAQEADGLQVAHQVFEGLTSWATNDDGQMVVAPGIAASWETGDSQTWVFHLKKGVTFAAPVSRPVTAADVVASWERVTDPANRSYVSYILAPIQGCGDDGYQVDPAAGLTGVRAVDDSTLEVKLRYPFADLPTALGHPVAAVTPVDYIEQIGEKAYARRPVGTGPYQVAAWKPGRSIELTRNAAYWDTEHAGWVERIELPIIVDRGVMWREFQEGGLDCSRVPADEIASVQAMPQVVSGEWATGYWPSPAVGFVGLNMRDEALGTDPQLRQALSRAADAQAVVDEAGGGVPVVAGSYVPPGIVGHAAVQTPYPYDAQKAAEAVQALGVLPPLTYWYAEAEGGATMAATLSASWAAAGLQVETEGLQGPVLFDRLWSPDAESGLQLFSLGYILDYPCMDNVLYPLFFSETTGGSFTGYASRAVDEILLQARQTEDAPQRVNLYAQAEKLVLTDMPAIPLYFFRDFLVTDERVGGFSRDAMGVVDMAAVWVRPEPSPSPSASPSP